MSNVGTINQGLSDIKHMCATVSGIIINFSLTVIELPRIDKELFFEVR